MAKLAATIPFAKIANIPHLSSREKVLYGKPNTGFAIEIAKTAANFANSHPTAAIAAATQIQRPKDHILQHTLQQQNHSLPLQ